MRGHAIQVDVKFIAPLSSPSRKKYYQLTAIDDCTRIRVLRIYDRFNQKTAVAFAGYLLNKFPFRIEVIQTDGGAVEVTTSQLRVELMFPAGEAAEAYFKAHQLT